jgi:IS5 family transposase
MYGIVAKLDLEVSALPDFTTLCELKSNLEMWLWRDLLRLSAELNESGEMQVTDATEMDRIAAS